MGRGVWRGVGESAGVGGGRSRHPRRDSRDAARGGPRRGAAQRGGSRRSEVRGGVGTGEAGGSLLGASASNGVGGEREVLGCQRSRDLARAWCPATVCAVVVTRYLEARELVPSPRECLRRGGPPRRRTSQHPRAEDSDLRERSGLTRNRHSRAA